MNVDFVLFISVLIMSVVVHEVAHAWQARREGDLTAHELGRITLNPVPHLDLFGSLIIPGLLFFSSSGILFGWAKPVPVNPANFREHPWGDIRVSLAGIVSNLILAVLFVGVTVASLQLDAVLGAGAELVQRAAYFGVFINLLLAYFNLLPIPPLDGSHVLAHLLPPHMARRYREFGRWGVLVLLIVVFALPGALSVVLSPVTGAMGLLDSFLRIWV